LLRIVLVSCDDVFSEGFPLPRNPVHGGGRQRLEIPHLKYNVQKCISFRRWGGSNLAAVQNDGIVSTTEFDGRYSSFGSSSDQIITLCTVYYVKKTLELHLQNRKNSIRRIKKGQQR